MVGILPQHIRFAIRVLLGYPRRSLPVMGCLTVAGLFEGVGFAALLPLLSLMLGEAEDQGPVRFVADTLSDVGIEMTIVTLLIIIVAVISLKAGILWLARRQVGYATAQVATDLRHRLISAIVAVRWPYYVTKPVGALSNSLTIEAEAASNVFFHAARFAANAVMVAIYLGLALFVQWQVSVAAIVVGLLSVILLQRFVEISRAAGRAQTELLKSTASTLVDRLNGFKALKAMGKEKVLSGVLAAETDELQRVKRREIMSKEGLAALQEPVFVIAVALGIYGAIEILNVETSVLLMLVIVFLRTLTRIGNLQVTLQGVARCEGAYRAIHATIAKAESEGEVLEGRLQPRFERAIEFRNLRFGYADSTVLDGLHLEVKAGSFTALMGPSGAGKTTVIDLITGLLRPWEGDVWIDDHPLAEIDMRAWRNMIGYVPQEVVLLNDSLRANITLGDRTISDADIDAALQAAGLWLDATALPEGLETMVGEKGLRFSGGQRQRIALARALVRKPRLLILDEATSALDSETEAAVLETVGGLRGRTTILAISHRPAVQAAADVVYRMTDGRVRLERGLAA